MRHNFKGKGLVSTVEQPLRASKIGSIKDKENITTIVAELFSLMLFLSHTVNGTTKYYTATIQLGSAEVGNSEKDHHGTQTEICINNLIVLLQKCTSMAKISSAGLKLNLKSIQELYN